jgi:hypothetical protein
MVLQIADPCLRQAGLSTSRARSIPRLRDGTGRDGKETVRDFVRDDTVIAGLQMARRFSGSSVR